MMSTGKTVVNLQCFIQCPYCLIKPVQGEKGNALIAPCPYIPRVLFKGTVKKNDRLAKPAKVNQSNSFAD